VGINTTFLVRPLSRLLLGLLILYVVLSKSAAPEQIVHSAPPLIDHADKLAYVLTNPDNTRTLMLYDPVTATKRSVISNKNSIWFNFGVDGRLAYTWKPDGKSKIYILDTTTNNPTFEFSPNLGADNYPNGWSPDGYYLAYSSFWDDKKSVLGIWNGKTSIDITPSDLASVSHAYWTSWSPDGRYLAFAPDPLDTHHWIYIWDGHSSVNITPENLERIPANISFSWSTDDRLAFTFQYDTYVNGVRVDGDPGEIYYWDGKSTFNLSQNPSGNDYGVTWDTDGRLAFLSERKDSFHIFVWDGITTKNGIPDKSTFAEVAPGIIDYYSFPIWTNNGQLAFKTQSSQDTHVQIYLWDGSKATNISQNPSFHNGNPRWNKDGLWAFATFYSPQQLIYVRNTKNEPLLTISGQSPIWNSIGYLTFCSRTDTGWALSIWDKQQTIIIDQGGEIGARWQSGSWLGCSSG
jgi:Tol biopolymer transport system component